MEENFKRPRRKTIELWRIMILVAGAFTFTLFAFGRVPSRETHENILTSLRAVDVNHASLQRDVLQARAGLLRDYDPLVEPVRTLHSTVARLSYLFRESGVEAPAALADELAKLSSSIDEDEKLVEKFKTDNALLQNSLSIATQMLSKLHNQSSLGLSTSLNVPDDLGNLMMRFTTQPSRGLDETIRANLTEMQKSSFGSLPEIQAYVAHARMILDTLPEVDNILQAIQASQTSEDARKLQIVYLDAYGELSARSSWSRVLLGSIAVLLCVYVAWLIYRLRRQTQKLAQQLELETLIGDMKNRFSEGLDDGQASLSDALRMIAGFFDAGRHAFAVLDVETGNIKSAHGEGDMAGFDGLLDSFRADIKSNRKTRGRIGHPFLYENLQQRDFAHFPEGSLSAGSVVATEIDSTSIGLLFLEHNEIRQKPDRDEVRLLGQALMSLTQCLKAQRDQTELQTLEARLEHAQRLEALGTLAGGIAHEFNNALGAILGYGEMALQLGRSSPKTRNYVQEMVSSGQRAKFIIDQILTFSRKRDRVSNPFDATAAIRDILPMMRMAISDTFSLKLELADNVPAILGNPIELQQVVMNLCTNAFQASSKEGEIRITVTQREEELRVPLSHGELTPGSYVIVTIEDNGSGIADSVLPHIFEPFFTTKSKRGGTGLGLAAVHGHVVGMNGRINVHSEINVGTRFDLYFPASFRKPIPLADFFNEQSVPLGSGQTVLLAQSDVSLRLLFEEKIAALGYEPVGFSSISALSSWISKRSTPPDLVVLDTDLWDELPDFRAIVAQFAPIPTVFVTDHATGLADLRSLKDVATLRKPVSSNNLATTLYNQLSGQLQPTDVPASEAG
jgi:signal transduction histidine kinase